MLNCINRYVLFCLLLMYIISLFSNMLACFVQYQIAIIMGRSQHFPVPDLSSFMFSSPSLLRSGLLIYSYLGSDVSSAGAEPRPTTHYVPVKRFEWGLRTPNLGEREAVGGSGMAPFKRALMGSYSNFFSIFTRFRDIATFVL